MKPSSAVAPSSSELRTARGDAETGAEARALAEHRAAIRRRLDAAGAVRSGSSSVSWKINRELIVVAGWGRAILLQLAHPLIAAAVADHSSFRGSLTSGLSRLRATVGAMLAMTFGTDEQAIDAAARINRIHDRVSGRLGESAGVFAPSERYSAHDPSLLRWVHATLLESIPLTYELLVGCLTPEERDRYCAEAAIVEPLLDIQPDLLPRNWTTLERCMRETLQSSSVVITDRSRTLAQAFLFPPGWWLMWPAFRTLQLVTIGLLPSDVRKAYGFTWTARDRRALARWSAVLRLLHRMTPPLLREWPAARRHA